MQGRSLWPLIRGEAAEVREFAVSGRYAADVIGAVPDAAAFDGVAGATIGGEPLTLTAGRWSYLCPARGGGARELYDLEADPNQQSDLIKARPDVAHDLHGKLLAFLAEKGAASERIDLYKDEPEAPDRTPVLPLDAALHTVVDERGRRLGFPTRREAEEALAAGLPEQSIGEVTLGDLRREDPEALVSLRQQYYHAEEMA